MDTTDGLPEITPVSSSMDSPVGRAGETEYESIGPPVLVGAESVMAVPLVSVNVLDE